jgi:hypothetical protein
MKQKQAHLKTISALGLTAIIVLFSIYFPLAGLVLFSICLFIALYMAIYTLFKD